MNIGRFLIEHLSEGKFKVYPDGSFQKIKSQKPGESLGNTISGVRTYATTIGIDPVLVRDHNRCILLDAGLGWGLDHKSPYRRVSNMISNLAIFDVDPGDITDVILSHLHYDHAAGSTYTDEESHTVATLPNATYHVQRREWDHALSRLNSEKLLAGAGYQMDELYRLAAEDRFHFIEKDYKRILPGIEIIWTGGHTPGHQVVRISSEEETGYYLGDLVPSDSQLNHYAMKKADLYPGQSKQMKKVILRQALQEDAYVLFYHSLYTKHGKLTKDENRKYTLEQVEAKR